MERLDCESGTSLSGPPARLSGPSASEGPNRHDTALVNSSFCPVRPWSPRSESRAGHLRAPSTSVVGVTSPTAMLSKVVLPTPFKPTSAPRVLRESPTCSHLALSSTQGLAEGVGLDDWAATDTPFRPARIVHAGDSICHMAATLRSPFVQDVTMSRLTVQAVQPSRLRTLRIHRLTTSETSAKESARACPPAWRRIGLGRDPTPMTPRPCARGRSTCLGT